MKPSFTISAQDKDITALIKDRFLGLVIRDGAGVEADTFELLLDDHPPGFALPAMGGNLSVSLGYGDELVFMGSFVADEMELNGPERTLRIVSRAADMVDTLKERKERSWHALTLQAIVETIAGEHNLVPSVHPDFLDINIEHVDQTNESDFHFLMRLGRERRAIAKPAGGYLLFVPRRGAVAASGKKMESVTLKPGEVEGWRVSYTERNRYKSCITRWHDNELGRSRPVRVNEDRPAFFIRQHYPDAETALAAAKAKLEELRLGTAKLELNMSGRPEFCAEGELNLVGFRDGVDGLWVIAEVEHSLTEGGYTMRIQAERPG